MKLSIDTNVLKKYQLSLGEFLVLLMSHYDINYIDSYDLLVNKGLADKNLFKEFCPILSDNIKSLVAKILIESDDKVINCSIDIDELAIKLQALYPDGVKAGKTYTWRGDTDEIAFKLRTLIAKYDFSFTEEEAINAVKEYVDSFKAPYQYMHTLKNFLLFIKKNQGCYEMESIFMSIIENNREQ